ncbi:MAG: hypothetical protein QXL15_05155 [Candidatus Korarchaeota archaeon]
MNFPMKQEEECAEVQRLNIDSIFINTQFRNLLQEDEELSLFSIS